MPELCPHATAVAMWSRDLAPDDAQLVRLLAVRHGRLPVGERNKTSFLNLSLDVKEIITGERKGIK